MQSIIDEAIKIGDEDPQLFVLGAISSPVAMPNQADSKRGDAAVLYKSNGKNDTGKKQPAPTIFDSKATHIVRAFNITSSDPVGNFEAELLSAGNAIIHDKIVVIDPLSSDCVVVMGSHNLGYKASYGNDENLVIIRGHQKLAQAYAVHVLDVYDHYRFRAVQEDRIAKKQSPWDGFLQLSDKWQDDYVQHRKGDEVRYFGG